MRIARIYHIGDEEILLFFRRFISNVPHAQREALLDDNMFCAGFVAGLVYGRSQVLPAHTRSNRDVEILGNFVQTAIKQTQHTPYVSNN